MRGFTARADVADVSAFIERTAAPKTSERVSLLEAAGRVLSADVVAGADVPGFSRSAMDGFAVRGEETFGASDYEPVALRVVGESFPGNPFGGDVASGRDPDGLTAWHSPDGVEWTRIDGFQPLGPNHMSETPTSLTANPIAACHPSPRK